MAALRTDGGPAFPRRLPNIDARPDEAFDIIRAYSGMTLRDFFASQALSESATASVAVHLYETAMTDVEQRAYAEKEAERAARAAYMIADALLLIRESK